MGKGQGKGAQGGPCCKLPARVHHRCFALVPPDASLAYVLGFKIEREQIWATFNVQPLLQTEKQEEAPLTMAHTNALCAILSYNRGRMFAVRGARFWLRRMLDHVLPKSIAHLMPGTRAPLAQGATMAVWALGREQPSVCHKIDTVFPKL